jgi:hypothetical protein
VREETHVLRVHGKTTRSDKQRIAYTDCDTGNQTGKIWETFVFARKAEETRH